MTSAPDAPSTDLAQAAEVVRAALTARYGVPVVRIAAGHVEVPAGNAVAHARAALQWAGLSQDLARPLQLVDLPWLGSLHVIRLWRQHGSTDEMVTELLLGDPPVQPFAEHEGWRLARTIDGATGWIEPDVDLELEYPAPRHLGPDDWRLVGCDDFVTRALELLGTPYVWGGTTSEGIDCSGLIQRSAWESDGIWLPRHSTALLKVGQRIAPSQGQRGDVLVLKRDLTTVEDHRADFARRHPMHVALLEDPENTIHASRDAMAVVREPLAALRQRYRILGVRRLT